MTVRERKTVGLREFCRDRENLKTIVMVYNLLANRQLIKKEESEMSRESESVRFNENKDGKIDN